MCGRSFQFRRGFIQTIADPNTGGGRVNTFEGLSFGGGFFAYADDGTGGSNDGYNGLWLFEDNFCGDGFKVSTEECDGSDGVGAGQVCNSTCNIVNLVYPIFSNYWDNDGSLVGGGIALFNATVDNTNGSVFLSINGVNYTATNLTYNLYNVSVNLSSGIYTYYWGSWGNGSTKEYNISGKRQYLVNLSAADPEDTQNHGGGGGGSSVKESSKKYSVSQSQLVSGYVIGLFKNDGIVFPFNRENHSLFVIRINSSGVVFNVSSDTQISFLAPGEERSFDLNNDLSPDIKVKLDSFTSLLATFNIHAVKIEEPPSAPEVEMNESKNESAVVASNENLAESGHEKTEVREKHKSIFLIIGVLTVIFLVGIFIVRRNRLRRYDKEVIYQNGFKIIHKGV